MNNRLYVGNLSYDTTQDALQDAFGAYGPVQEVNLMYDRETGRSRGFCFVTMENGDDAQKAIDGLNGKDLDGRSLKVNIARPREERERGGGGGGGGYGGGRGNRDRY